jgi:hypothetical protein
MKPHEIRARQSQRRHTNSVGIFSRMFKKLKRGFQDQADDMWNENHIILGHYIVGVGEFRDQGDNDKN